MRNGILQKSELLRVDKAHVTDTGDIRYEFTVWRNTISLPTTGNLSIQLGLAPCGPINNDSMSTR